MLQDRKKFNSAEPCSYCSYRFSFAGITKDINVISEDKKRCPICGGSKKSNAKLCIECGLNDLGYTESKSSNEKNYNERSDYSKKNSDSKFYSSKDISSEEVKMGRILKLKGKVTWSDIKKNWKKGMAEYHPDKVSHLGDDIKKLAIKRTLEIQEAYDYFREKYKK